MNIFKNKFFLLGNLAFLLITIPVALFIIQKRTANNSNANPTTTLSFTPPSLSMAKCDTTKTANLIVVPHQNQVIQVRVVLKWDKTKFNIEFAPNKETFTEILNAPEQTSTGMTFTLATGADLSKAISTTTTVGTLTIKPLLVYTGTLSIDTTSTEVRSNAGQDVSTENVYNPAGSTPLNVTITDQTCNTEGAPVPTATIPAGNNPTTPVSPTTAPIISPTAATNQAPLCQSLLSSVAQGTSPLAVTFTATGRDQNGTITKTTFNFGDGTQQDVVIGMGTASVSAQLAHTYANGGNFTATTVFTDNSGAISPTCTKLIAVTGAVATLPPTVAPTTPPTPTLAPIITSPPTPTPTLAPSGNIIQSVGIASGVVLIIIAGIFLLAL